MRSAAANLETEQPQQGPEKERRNIPTAAKLLLLNATS